MTEHRLFLIGGADDEFGILTVHDDDDRCRLEFSYRNKQLVATATDFFESFCKIRRDLGEDGLIPFCYGASLNVYPSGMGRDMGAGLKAYKLTLGKHATTKDLEYIFAEGADVIPAPVSRQREFYEEWLITPKNK